jgi:uncharacterized protein
MILYLDTSAFVKLYVVEAHSADVRSWAHESSACVTAVITYVEARSCLARLRRLNALSPFDARRGVAELDAGWHGYALVDVTEDLVLYAGRLAEEHGLRGYDAVQLAAALHARSGEGDLLFACFDQRLNDAAAREGLVLTDPALQVRERSPVYPAPARVRTRPRVAASGRSR